MTLCLGFHLQTVWSMDGDKVVFTEKLGDMNAVMTIELQGDCTVSVSWLRFSLCCCIFFFALRYIFIDCFMQFCRSLTTLCLQGVAAIWHKSNEQLQKISGQGQVSY